jgi:DNA-binding GntR family transcriptional regulator
MIMVEATGAIQCRTTAAPLMSVPQRRATQPRRAFCNTSAAPATIEQRQRKGVVMAFAEQTERVIEERQVFTERAYTMIKRDIVRCALDPGQQVTEQQLAARYGIGRAAVRAALKRLYQEQLVQTVTRNRYVIAPITLKYVKELFELRLLLEPAAARLAAGRVDGAALGRLNDLCRVNYRVGDHESAAQFLAANTEFHAAVAVASGNALLANVIRDLLDKVERVHHMSHLLHDRNEEAFHEHQELVDALVAGDGARAEAVMAQQILAARAFVIDAMMNSALLQSVNVVAARA